MPHSPKTGDKHRPTARRSAGFTLIELLTVIAIIGILAAIVIPITANVRQTARNSRCVSNLRQIGIGMTMSADENGRTFPAQTLTEVDSPLEPATTEPSWIRAVAPYLNTVSQTQTAHVLSCPDVLPEQTPARPFSYAMNKYLAGLSVSKLHTPARKVLVRHTQQSRSSFVVAADIKHVSSGGAGLVYSDKNGDYFYLFADGHVAKHTPLLGAEHWNPAVGP